MDEWYYLNLKLQIEILITEREQFIAINKQYEIRGEHPPHGDKDFEYITNSMNRLLGIIRDF